MQKRGTSFSTVYRLWRQQALFTKASLKKRERPSANFFLSARPLNPKNTNLPRGWRAAKESKHSYRRDPQKIQL